MSSLARLLRSLVVLAAALGATATADAQVHYQPSGWPWTAQAGGGPDAAVPGWYYNLGITGLRVELVETAPKELVVRHVFAGSPADGKVAVGEHLTGAGGVPFAEPHQNGYGMAVFGAQGPVGELAVALEAAQTTAGKGELKLTVSDGTTTREETLAVGQAYGAFSPTFPAACPKSGKILGELLAYLVRHQEPSGSWGNPVNDLYAALALISSGRPAHLDAARACARNLAATTAPTSTDWLVNWRYMTAGIVLSEFYLATGEAWVLPELTEVRDFLYASQYTDRSQVDPQAAVTHPGSFPADDLDSHGGWGHNPGFEGYGPIAMLTGEGALVYALMERCGLAIDAQRHGWAYDFLERGTNQVGYLWYADEVASPTDWADQGRTGASALAHWLSPYPDTKYRRRALACAEQIGANAASFPDTHGSPILGMGFAAAATAWSPPDFRKLMDANRWWFALAQCPDGSFVYQPNRDNAGYGADSRVSASAVTAFVFSIPAKDLAITGKP